jgi:hypothetical protein
MNQNAQNQNEAKVKTSKPSNSPSGERIGDYLRSCRESKSYTVEFVSKETKINGGILYGIEANDFDNLPSKTYVRGFIINYCRLVGADKNKAIQLLNQEYQEFKSEVDARLDSVSKKISEDFHTEKVALSDEAPSELEKSLRTAIAGFFYSCF